MKRVYFLRPRGERGPIKIGCSVYPDARRKQLGADMRLPLELLAEIEAGHEVERMLHERFSTHRVVLEDLPERPWPIAGVKEWFEPVPELLELVDYIRQHRAFPEAIFDGALSSTDRNRTIFRRRARGETLQSIANDFAISRERVRQIVSEIHARNRRFGIAA